MGFEELPEEIRESVAAQVDEVAMRMIAHQFAHHDEPPADDAVIVLPSGRQLSYGEFAPMIPLYLPARPHGRDALLPALSDLRNELRFLEAATEAHREHYLAWCQSIGEAADEAISGLHPDSMAWFDDEDSPQTWFQAALVLSREHLVEEEWPAERIDELADALFERGMVLFPDDSDPDGDDADPDSDESPL